MQSVWFVVKRKLRGYEKRTIVFVLAIALVMSTMCTAFSMCDTFASYFFADSAASDESAADLILHGFRHYAQLFLFLFQKKPGEGGRKTGDVAAILSMLYQTLTGSSTPLIPVRSGPEKPTVAQLFAAEAATENAAAAIVLAVCVAVLAAYLCLSALFSLYRKRNRAFYAGLIVVGASVGYVRKCARLEGALYGAAGVLCGTVVGCIEPFLVRAVMRAVSIRRGMSGDLPWDMRLSFRVIPIAALLTFLMVAGLCSRFARKLTVRQSLSQSRALAGRNLGASVLPESERAYRRSRFSKIIGKRLFSENILSYVRVFLLSTFVVSAGGVATVTVTIVRNFNRSLPGVGSPFLQSLFCTELFFCAFSAVMFVTALIGVICAVYATAENAKVYALMRASGSSVRRICRAVRKETALCMFYNTLVTVSVTAIFAAFFTGSYLEDNTSLQGGGIILWTVGAEIVLLLAAMLIVSVFSVRRVRQTDWIGVLR